MQTKIIILLFVIIFALSGESFASHPLITDDAGTQGKGKFQFEMNFEHAHESGNDVTVDESRFVMSVTCGVTEKVDLVFGIPVLHVRTGDHGVLNTEGGLSDVTLEAKWRFHESDGLAFAVKPGISFPSGDEGRGLGAGEVGGSIYFIATKELDPFAFHFNAGYIRNGNAVDEGVDLWHVSLASEWKVLEWMKVVANAGAEGGRDKETDTPGAFILGGLIFTVLENIDLDVGLKGSFTESAEGYSVLAGATLRF